MVRGQSGKVPTGEWLQEQRELIALRLDDELGSDVPTVLLCGEDDKHNAYVSNIVRRALPSERLEIVVERSAAEAAQRRHVWVAIVASDADDSGGADTGMAIAAANPHALVVATFVVYSAEWLSRVLTRGGLECAQVSNLHAELPGMLQRGVKRRRWLRTALEHDALGARIAYTFGWEVAEQFGFDVPVPAPPKSDAQHRREQIERALLIARGNQAEASRILKWNKSTFHRRVHGYQITAPTLAKASETIRAVRHDLLE